MASNDDEYEYFGLGSEMVEEEIQIEYDVARLSVGDVTSKVNLYDKPRQLISTDEKGLLEVNSEVLAQLSQVEKKINVVGVCGAYRTGKSYLMNWIADKKTGFDLGDTIQSETKGIWIWCRKHPTHSDQVLVLLDTEGLNDPEKGNPKHDNKLFCLTLLLSSTLVVNIKDVFNYETLDKLAFITSLSQHVKVLDDEAEETNNAKAIKVASPCLIMCIRDFFLKSSKDGKSLTPDEYLEDNLKLVEGSTTPTNHVKFNRIKKSIKDYFPKRKCYTIAQPAIGEDLQNIEELDESSLAEKFVVDIKALRKYVYDRKPKYICNASKKPLDGADLASLISFYVKSFREDCPLICQDAYDQAATQRNKRVFEKVLYNFKKDMKKGGQLNNKEELQTKIFLPAFDNACSKYREGAFLTNEDEFENKIMDEMTAHLDKIKAEIAKRCMEKGTKKLSKMYDDMLQRNKSRYVSSETGHSNYEADMENLKTDFFNKKEKYDKDVLYRCFDEFTKSKSDYKMTLYRMATGQRNNNQYDKLSDEINKRMDGQLERILFKESERRRQNIEDELARLKAENEELLKSVNKRKLCSIM